MARRVISLFILVLICVLFIVVLNIGRLAGIKSARANESIGIQVAIGCPKRPSIVVQPYGPLPSKICSSEYSKADIEDVHLFNIVCQELK